MEKRLDPFEALFLWNTVMEKPDIRGYRAGSQALAH